MKLFFRKWLKMYSRLSVQNLNERGCAKRSLPLLLAGSFLATWVALGSQALAVDGGAGYESGAHNQKIAAIRGPVCTYCHFSKAGKKEGEKIWADTPLGAQTIPGARGIKTICGSCHYPGNAVNARSGFTLGSHEPKEHDFINGNVLLDTSLLGIGENHVMAEQVELDPNRGKLPASLDESTFPLAAASDNRDSGFTCTSCHDPHTQPNHDISGRGDYLRTREEKSVGQPDQRTSFCLQCHRVDSKNKNSRQHGASLSCSLCHHPHDGYYQLGRQPQLARAILISKVRPVKFKALPNVVAFGPAAAGGVEAGGGGEEDVSSLCYSCHGPSASPQMREAGARPLFGDDCETKRAHHPMGSQAQLGRAPRAPGLNKAVLNSSGQVTCTSCHNGFHRGKNLHFLRANFTADSATLCTFCHCDKSAKELGAPGYAHRQLLGQSPNQRGECMFCHFIHDGPDRGSRKVPATEALLRPDPVNLAWSDQAADTDTEDFEDLCFGCHSSDLYMKGSGAKGAKLQPDKYFSHRISSVPSEKIHPTLPISDGDQLKVVDDYGAGQGKIYCGSCHDVHKSANPPYLRDKDSPYRGSGFCARCHSELPAGGQSSHPVNVFPRPGITDERFPRFAYGGKSGLPYGITSDESPSGQLLCLSCHSIHAAKTSPSGQIKLASSAAAGRAEGRSHGKLLVVDNFSSQEGSDLCRGCHTPYESIVGSRHDFSNLNLVSSTGGVCAACHIPHGSSEKIRLWARSLAQERKIFSQTERPNYTLGVTLLCYDCHDDHSTVDDDPPINAFLYPPQDIAFSDGPGKNSKVGFYETIPPGSIGESGLGDLPPEGMETGGHYIKTASLTETTNGINTGDKLSCSLCHDPHNRPGGNEAFLRSPLGTTSDRLRASRNSRNGTGTGREICAACHGYSESDLPKNTPVRLFGVEIVKTPSQDKLRLVEHTAAEHSTPCTKCHLHNRMAVPKSPRTGPGTHEFHFRSLLAGGEDSILLHQQTQGGAAASGRNCDICHSPELYFKAGKLIFNDGKPLAETSVCDICHSRWGRYDGVNGNSATNGAKASWEKGVYDKQQTDWQLKPGKEEWCISCHDDQPSRIQNPSLPETLWVQAPNILGDPTDRSSGFYISGHGLPKGGNYEQSGRGGAGLDCTACHAPQARHIVNSQREKKKNFKNWQANNFRLRLPLELPRRSEEYRSTDFTLCFSCHKEASIIGLPPGYWDYTDNHNPYVNLNVNTYPLTSFSNADEHGIYPLRKMGQGITIDFSKLFPMRRYNLHWNHLSLPDAVIDPNAIIRPQPQSSSSSSNNRRRQTCYSSRCHAGTSIVKERPYAFWDSDRDGILDSRPSCTACHNPHGSHYISMTRDDLAIEHRIDEEGEEYGSIGSREYGVYDDSLDNYLDLYCWECHGKLQRVGGNYRYYPRPLMDRTAPEPPE